MIETAFILALSVLFIHVTTWEGMINEWVAIRLYHLPDWIKKPLFDCPICMAPWWGFCIYSVLGWCDAVHYLAWPALVIVLFMAGGINTVLIYLISTAKVEGQVLNEIKDDDEATN